MIYLKTTKNPLTVRTSIMLQGCSIVAKFYVLVALTSWYVDVVGK
jgi:hypothetical protein